MTRHKQAMAARNLHHSPCLACLFEWDTVVATTATAAAAGAADSRP